jgi:hypothetical protein
LKKKIFLVIPTTILFIPNLPLAIASIENQLNKQYYLGFLGVLYSSFPSPMKLGKVK